MAQERNAAKYGFGWGLVSYDFNNDTLADYLITQNYIRFPAVKYLELYPGNLLQQYADGRFQAVEKTANIQNKNFGVTTVVSDFNNDGWPDVVIGNLDGSLRAMLNQPNDNHWLTLEFEDDVESLGALITLTMAAPLYILGYWHLGQMFIQGGSKITGWIITLLGGYAFMVGNAWQGGCIYLALTAHEIAGTENSESIVQLSHLLANFSAHNEPLVNALRLAMVVVSIVWIWRIAIGKTLFPRWVAIFSPAILLGAIFATYFTGLAIGVWLLPAAMNVVHLAVFSLSLYALYRSQQQ